jgi:CheY-like chemotaxis protein
MHSHGMPKVFLLRAKPSAILGLPHVYLPSEFFVKKILVLDDRPESLFVLKAIFENRQYGAVVAVSDPNEAIRVCNEPPSIDLFVCDVVLRSSMTGVETAVRLHEQCPVPILLTSGTGLEGWHDDDHDSLRKLLPHRVDFIQKPFTADQLMAAVDMLMNRTSTSPEFIAMFQLAVANRQSAESRSSLLRFSRAPRTGST